MCVVSGSAEFYWWKFSIELLVRLGRSATLTAPPSEMLMPLFCPPRRLSILLVCERLGSLLDERISLCTLRFPLQGLAPLQTNEETWRFVPKLSARNGGSLPSDGGWTTQSFRSVHQVSLVRYRWAVISWGFLSPLLFSVLQHLYFFVVEINSNVYVSGTLGRCGAENRCVLTAVTLTDSEVEKVVQSGAEISGDCGSSGSRIWKKNLLCATSTT